MHAHPNHVHPRHKRKAIPAPYKPLAESVSPKSTRRQGMPMPSFVYRGAKRNLARYPSRAQVLKKARKMWDVSRQDFDRWRSSSGLLHWPDFMAWFQAAVA